MDLGVLEGDGDREIGGGEVAGEGAVGRVELKVLGAALAGLCEGDEAGDAVAGEVEVEEGGGVRGGGVVHVQVAQLQGLPLGPLLGVLVAEQQRDGAGVQVVQLVVLDHAAQVVVVRHVVLPELARRRWADVVLLRGW